MVTLAWESVREEFAFDGSWRDIYVFATDMAGWQRMLDALRDAGYDHSYSRDARPAELPARAEDAFPLHGEFTRLLGVRFDGVLANCHFFTPDELEFDIDPREVVGQTQLDGLFAFMRCVADAVGGDAVLCPENCPHVVVLRVRPGAAGVEHQFFGGWHDWRR